MKHPVSIHHEEPFLALMVDVESDGLHGDAFAVGAILARLSPEGVEELDVFSGMAELDLLENDWVVQNVLPSLEKNPLPLFPSRRGMRDAFWSFYMDARERGAEIWGDCIWPVESNFFHKLVQDAPEARFWNGPFPFQDLATLLPVDISRAEFTGMVYDHNPVNDARASIHSLQKVLFGK